jgi:hypothetical protein
MYNNKQDNDMATALAIRVLFPVGIKHMSCPRWPDRLRGPCGLLSNVYQGIIPQK